MLEKSDGICNAHIASTKALTLNLRDQESLKVNKLLFTDLLLTNP